jgi:surfactin synthase thioesterase subunit
LQNLEAIQFTWKYFKKCIASIRSYPQCELLDSEFRSLSKMLAQTNPWIFGGRLSPNPRCRLFCLPHSGSGASQFATWKNYLPPVLDICPIQLPGRENRFREPPLTQLRQIAEILAVELRPYLDRPYILYGYSLGALIAFELARQLRKQNVAPAVSLYALARPAPHLPQTRYPLHQLPDDLFLSELTHRFNGMAPAILQDKELMELLLPALRADFTALETYVYQSETPLDFPIHAFGGSFDPTTTEDDLLAWQLQTNGRFELQIFPGDHFFIRNNQQSIFQSISAAVPGGQQP